MTAAIADSEMREMIGSATFNYDKSIYAVNEAEQLNMSRSTLLSEYIIRSLHVHEDESVDVRTRET